MRGPTSWLIPCAMLGAMLVALPEAVCAGDDDPRAWLEKMNQALATRNYDGMFMHVSDGRIETMRIVHRVLAGRVTEFYQIDSLAPTRVLGKPVRVIAVNPKDQFRFGYRLWLDEKTAMPLKTQLCDARGNVIEQIVFARLDMPDSIADSELAPTVRTEGMRWVHQNPGDNASTDLPGYRASQLPPGFHLTVAGAQTLGGASVAATHLVYSDGLATVSVFVEAGAHDKSAAEAAFEDPPREGLVRVGSGFIYSTVVEGHQVTAVGEVPAQTVEFIGRSVKLSGAAELTQH